MGVVGSSTIHQGNQEEPNYALSSWQTEHSIGCGTGRSLQTYCSLSQDRSGKTRRVMTLTLMDKRDYVEVQPSQGEILTLCLNI